MHEADHGDPILSTWWLYQLATDEPFIACTINCTNTFAYYQVVIFGFASTRSFAFLKHQLATNLSFIACFFDWANVLHISFSESGLSYLVLLIGLMFCVFPSQSLDYLILEFVCLLFL